MRFGRTAPGPEECALLKSITKLEPRPSLIVMILDPIRVAIELAVEVARSRSVPAFALA